MLLGSPDDNYLRDEEIWADDPVHMTAKGYAELAWNLEAKIEEWKENDEKEEKARAGGVKRPVAKRARVDLTKQRPDWVCGNVGEALRTEKSSASGSSRGWKPTVPHIGGGRTDRGHFGGRGGTRGDHGGRGGDRGRGGGRGGERGGHAGRGGSRGS